ncbi:glycosyltransferase family 2 protein [Paenibacillus spiritus]|nr:glycosyltransferase [Paenibacillus spiritus]
MTDVGVVMPVYTQRPDYVCLALQSLLVQTCREFRLVVVLDGDPLMEPLVRTAIGDDARVTVLAHPENRGVAAALNTGFDVLSEDPEILYWTWVSSDNWYHPRFLEILRRTLAEGPEELGLVYSSFQSIDEAGNPLHDEPSLALLRQYQSRPADKLLDSSLVGVSFMYKARYARQVGPYGMEPVEDYDYWLRLSELCRMRYIPAELMHYRVNSPHSISSALNTAYQHRRWRHAFHLARHQARHRRGIPAELTVLFPARDGGEREVEWLESLYEQTFSNYECRILDVSLGGTASTPLTAVSHPSTLSASYAGCSSEAAGKLELNKVWTRFVLVAGSAPFASSSDLQILIDHLDAADSSLLSCYYTDERLVGYRHRSSGTPLFDLRWNELFRTQELKEALG